MSWSVSGTSTWLSYNQAGGIIASGSSTTLSVTINSTANGLGVGNYGDTITFTNTTNSTGNTTRPAALTVLQPVPAITSALDVTGTNGFGFDYSISASNSPISYNATGLPAGLILSPLTGQISGTLAASGTFNAGISASNAVGTGSAALSITIQASLTGWRNQWFTPAQLADPGISGDTADPAGDGIPNLMKYALDLDPMANGSGGLPAGSMMAIGGSNYIVLTYTQLIAATDLTYIPQVSGDMQTWKSGAGYVAPVSVTPNADGITETVSVRDTTPVSRGAPRFIRLMVTGP